MNYVSKMSVGDSFDRTFKILGKTFQRNILIAIVVFVPAILIMVFALDHFIQSVLAIVKELDAPPDNPFPLLASLIKPGLFVLGAILVLSIGNLLVHLSMLNVLGHEMIGETRDWMEAMGAMASLPLFRAIGVSILQSLAIGAVVAIPMIIIITGIKWLIIIGVFGVFAGIGIAVWLGVSWAFTLVIVSIENDTILHSFVRSMYLVKDYWWRTLGMLILFGMTAQLAISLITTPVSFIALWGFWAKYFTLISSAASDNFDKSLIFDMFSSVGIGYGVLIGMSVLLTTLFQSSYMTVLYYDLRARKDEFKQPPSETESGSLLPDLPSPDEPQSDSDIEKLFQ